MNLSQQLMVMTFMTLLMMVKVMILDMKNLVAASDCVLNENTVQPFVKTRQRSVRPSNIDYILIDKNHNICGWSLLLNQSSVVWSDKNILCSFQLFEFIPCLRLKTPT